MEHILSKFGFHGLYLRTFVNALVYTCLFSFFFGIAPSIAFAEGAANESAALNLSDLHVTIGRRYRVDLTKRGRGPSTDAITLKVFKNQAYSCVLETPYNDLDVPIFFSTTLFGSGSPSFGFDWPFARDFTAHYATTFYPGTGDIRVVSFSVDSIEKEFEALIDNDVAIAFNHLETPPESGTGFVSCYNNTLLGSYNTNASPFSILELQNSSTAELKVFIHATNSAGVKVIDGKELDLPANREQHILLHEMLGELEYGSLVVNFEGPPNALSARVSSYVTEGGVLKFVNSSNLRKAQN